VYKIAAGSSHVDALDGLRGIAVLYVLLSHTSNSGLFLLPYMDFAWSGKYGVWLFFVLSSFLLTSQMLTALRSGQFNRSFMFRYFVARVFRIYPLYLLIVLMMACAGYIGWHDVLPYLALMDTSLHLWAIPVEFKFYFLLPILFVFFVYLFRERLLLFGLFFLLLYVLFSSYGGNLTVTLLIEDDPLSTQYHLPVFLMGFVAAVLYERKVAAFNTSVLLLALTVIVLLTPHLLGLLLQLFSSAGAMPPAMLRELVHGPAMELLIGVLWMVLLLAMLNSHRASTLFSTDWLAATGRISFSLYLFHFFILMLFSGMAMNATIRGWAVVLISLLLARLSWQWVEKPGMSAGKKVMACFLHGKSQTVEHRAKG